MTSKKHNPEKRVFKGRSYKKGGTRISKLKSSIVVLDWKEQLEVDELATALAPFGLKVIEHPACEGSDSYGFIITNRDLTEEELEEARNSM